MELFILAIAAIGVFLIAKGKSTTSMGIGGSVPINSTLQLQPNTVVGPVTSITSPLTVQPIVSTLPITPIPPIKTIVTPTLSDDEIIQMSYSIGFSNSNKTTFANQARLYLQVEQIADSVLNTQCRSGGQYQGQPLAIQVTKDGQLALGVVGQVTAALGIAGVALQAIPVVGTLIGAGLSIFSTIAAHHAQAVKNEQGLECQLIPSANQALTVIENAVMSGTITPLQGKIALSTLLSDFKTAAQNGQSGQLSEGPGKCNAMCWFYHYLQAIVYKKQNRYSNFGVTS